MLQRDAMERQPRPSQVRKPGRGAGLAAGQVEKTTQRPSAAERDTPRERQLWLLPGSGEERCEPVADVAVVGLRHELRAYSIPPELAAAIRPGVRVQVARGRSSARASGWCVGVSSQPWRQTRRPIVAIDSTQRPLPAQLVELGLWVSSYYACPAGVTLERMVPALARRAPAAAVRFLRAAASDDARRVTSRQQVLLDLLKGGELPRAEALRRAGVSAAVLAALRARGLVEQVTREAPPAPAAAGVTACSVPAAEMHCEEDDFTLTRPQEHAVREVVGALQSWTVFLLFGVPGSGKTEVYVRAMRRVIAAGRQAILLVPEIALTTQVVQRLVRRFARVAVLHSRLAPAQQRAARRRIEEGHVDVVIGTRSAVFAPCPRLGLIVVDEEQETSFKALGAPLYHARDVAIQRGRIEGVPVVLGSATPSLEAWHNAHALPHFRLLRLGARVPGAQVPRVRVVRAARAGDGPLLSAELCEQLGHVLAAGEQALLMHNRRGYAAHLRCAQCGLVVRCQRCGTRLALHRAANELRCHLCGLRSSAPTVCLDDTCRGKLLAFDPGVQSLERELQTRFPQARLLRLDRDAMRRRGDYVAALEAFAARQADILLGTQMVAKGLDFPAVRLVAVIEADASLSLPDFRAAERTFQLIVQVVGRAGRRQGDSLALVHCRDEPDPVIVAALRLDYEGFARRELELRHALGYPPFGRLLRLVCADERPGRAREESGRLERVLRGLAGRVDSRLVVHDAQPCVHRRLRDLLRYQVMVRGERDDGVQRLLRAARGEGLLWPRTRRLIVDVDPLDLF
jgi:primosomal protein N' (replication factor Y)